MGNTKKSKILILKEKYKQRIVICGSMSFYGDMLEIQKALQKDNIPSIVPEEENEVIASLSEEAFMAFKLEVSFNYLKKIRSPETVAILVTNKDKHGVLNYIGPNTFAEIAVAFAQKKKIFLLQGMPENYKDELEAWGAIPLYGFHNKLLEYYEIDRKKRNMQMDLFTDITFE
jgi:hypothetical protein